LAGPSRAGARNAEGIQAFNGYTGRADMGIFSKTPDWLGTETTETVIGVISGVIILFIIVAEIWQKLPG
jgi:hypothetical protein